MHFVITGGAGFIGSHVTEQLLSEGHYVTVVDNLTTGCLQNLPDHPHLKLLQKNVLACQPEDFTAQIDGIAHLAATPSVTASWENPLEAHHNNLSATLAVLQLRQALHIPKLVFASSAAVYGNRVELPILEDHTTNPISPYGLQKLVCEQYARLFAEKMHFSFIALRLFNVFGPRQVPSSPYSGVISIFVEAMQKGLPITIYGDGMQTRDFIYVKDVAKAFSLSLTSTMPSDAPIACNIATGKSISLNQLVSTLREQFPHWHTDIRFAPTRSGDIRHSQADISQAAAVLKFRPTWSVQSSIPLCIDSIRHTHAIL